MAINIAAYYGCHTPEQFCKDMGIKVTAILCGQKDALSHLAKLTGASEDELCRWSIRGSGSARKFINGQAVFSLRTSRRSWKFCPHCAREDVKASPDLPPDLTFYVRGEWQTSLLDVCVGHKVKLAHFRLRRPTSSDLLDFLSNFAVNLDDVVAEHCHPSLIDLYAYARLTGVSHAPVQWLDDLPLCDAISLACALGAAIGDVRKPWKNLTPEERTSFGAAGLTAFAQGEAGLLRAMSTIREKVWANSRSDGCVGRMKGCFDQIPTSDAKVAVGKALAHAAFATFPFLVGEKLFGVEYTTPVLLRSAGARRRLGIAQVVWKDLVAARPAWVVYSDGNSLRTLIDVEAAEEALRPHLPFINHRSLAMEYGLSSHDLKRLIASGVLPPNGIPGLTHRKTLACAPAASAALDAYFARAKRDRSEDVRIAANDNAAANHISLVGLSKRYAIEIGTTLDLIDSGTLTASKLRRSSNPYEEIGVDPIEALRAVYGVQDPMTARQVRDLLQLHNRALGMLVDAGFLSPKTRKFVNGKMSVFERSEIEKFRETYVTFGELLRSGVCRWGENLTPKWKAEVVPAYARPECIIYFRSHFSIAA